MHRHPRERSLDPHPIHAALHLVYLGSVERSAFEALVREALDDLPDEFARHLENVEIIIEDDPDPQLLRSLGMNPSRQTLFGLYQGVPLARRGANFGNALPDKISIFHRPLVRAYPTAERLRHQVRRTLIHEVGHYFGMNEKEIAELGYG